MSWLLLQFEVPGEPRGKGRPRFTRTGRTYTDDKTAAYENLVRLSFDRKYPGWEPTDKALKVDIIAYFRAPQSWSKRKQERAYAGDTPKVTKPDLDNIIKAVLDGLNETAWVDDNQVIDIRCRKEYWPEPKLTVSIWNEEYVEGEEDGGHKHSNVIWKTDTGSGA